MFSALSLRRKPSFRAKDSREFFKDDNCTIEDESSNNFDLVEGDEDRSTAVIRHVPPKTYINAPEPKKSAMCVKSACSSRTSEFNSLRECNESCVPRVNFGNVNVLTHGVELGDNPSVSWGPPLGLSWDVITTENYDIDSYEKTRKHRRGCRRLSPGERRRRLYRAGFSRSAVREVEMSMQDENEDDDEYYYLF